MQPVGEQVGAWGPLQAKANMVKDKIRSWEEALPIEPDECVSTHTCRHVGLFS